MLCLSETFLVCFPCKLRWRVVSFTHLYGVPRICFYCLLLPHILFPITTLWGSIKVFSYPSSSFPSVSLFPLFSHFHATRWVATLCFFISFYGKRGSPVPATNGLLRNTDSRASQSGELGRKGRRICSEAKKRLMLEREGERYTRERVVVKEKNKPKLSDSPVHTEMRYRVCRINYFSKPTMLYTP